MTPLIFTSYNNDIDPDLIAYQEQVINKFRGFIPFKPLKYDFHESVLIHGDILNMFIQKSFYDLGADCIMIIDVDCIPLSQAAIDTTFELAYAGHLVGNIQRANHLKNNQHVYAGSPFVCFSEKTFKKLGRPSMSYSYEGDTVEQLTYNAEKENIPITLYIPSTVEAPYNDNSDYWDLADGMPKYGIGTTYTYQNIPMTYHLFSSRLHKFNHYFINKCKSILDK